MIFDTIHQQQSNNHTNEQTTCKHELEKAYLIIEQKDNEIAYLKEIIELMKKQVKCRREIGCLKMDKMVGKRANRDGLKFERVDLVHTLQSPNFDIYCLSEPLAKLLSHYGKTITYY